MRRSTTRWLAGGAGLLALAGIGAGGALAAEKAETYKLSATLTPGQEVPKPVGSSGSGTFSGTLTTGGQLKYTLTFKGLTGKAFQAHIHLGKKGKAGAVIVPLCGPCTSPVKGAARMKKSLVEDVEEGGTYVNVHTMKNAAGEIRGQVASKD
jgi:CHRD domain